MLLRKKKAALPKIKSRIKPSMYWKMDSASHLRLFSRNETYAFLAFNNKVWEVWIRGKEYELSKAEVYFLKRVTRDLQQAMVEAEAALRPINSLSNGGPK